MLKSWLHGIANWPYRSDEAVTEWTAATAGHRDQTTPLEVKQYIVGHDFQEVHDAEYSKAEQGKFFRFSQVHTAPSPCQCIVLRLCCPGHHPQLHVP